MMFFSKKVLFIGVGLFGFFAQGQSEIRFQARVENPTVSVGEVFDLVVTLSSNENLDGADPRVPNLEGFEILNVNQSSSVRTQFINGDLSHEVSQNFVYSVIAKAEGKFTIPPFSLSIAGRDLTTQSISMTVLPQGSTPPGPRQGQRPQRGRPVPPGWPGFFDEEEDPISKLQEEMFNQLLQRRGFGTPGGSQEPKEGNPHFQAPPAVAPQYRSLPTNPNEAFFISVEVDKLEVFQNEQITVSWYLYTRGQMESLDRLKFPELKSFWKEIIEEIPSLQFSEEIINGAVYRKALLASHALFPIKAGSATIDEYKIKSRVRMAPEGFGYGFGKSYEYTRSSKPVQIKVKALPLEQRPPEFSGAVGQFKIHSGVEAQSIPVNQPFTLKIRIDGAGNAKLIELPPVAWPEGIEVYDTKSQSKFFKNGTSYKEFEVLLIPRKLGKLSLPSVPLAYFNPRTQSYEKDSSQTLEVEIIDNPNAPVGSSQRIQDKEKPKAEEKAWTPVMMLSPEKSLSAVWSQSPAVGAWAWVFALLVLLGRASFVLGWLRSRTTLGDTLKKRSQKIKQALSRGQFREVGAQVVSLHYEILGRLSGSTSRPGDDIQSLIQNLPVTLRQEFGERLRKNFEHFQTLTFAPEELLKDLIQQQSLEKKYFECQDVLSKLILKQGDQGGRPE